MKSSKRIIATLVLLSSLLLVILSAIQPTSAISNHSSDGISEWQPQTKISSSTHGARKPVIRSSPVSNHILLIYDQWKDASGDNRAPYYSLSTDGGTTWPSGQSIVNATGTSSQQAVGLLDYNDTAFAFWIEVSATNYSLVYSQRPVNGNWSAATIILTKLKTEGLLLDPNVTVDSNNTIHLVWSLQELSTGTDIYYSYRPEAGAWHSPIRISSPISPGVNPGSYDPAVAIANNGDLHIVWQEEALGGNDEIRYSAGTISGTQFIPNTGWDYVKLSAADYNNTILPLINIAGSKMEIAYTHYKNQNQQRIIWGSCILPCTGFGPNDFAPITNFVDVNGSDPFGLVADLAYSNQKNSSFIY